MLVAAVVLLGAASQPVQAHGASRGVHLHLTPNRVVAGAKFSLEIDCMIPIATYTASVTQGEPVRRSIDPPAAHAETVLTLPSRAVAGTTVNVQVEVRGTDGKLLRASALLNVIAPEGESRRDPREE